MGSLKTYEGSAFHPRFEDGRAAGTIEVGPAHLRFLPTDGSEWIDLPVDRLVIRAGGASNRLLFFSHPLHHDCSLYTTDWTILDDPDLRSSAHPLSQITAVQRGRAAEWVWIAAIVAIIVLLIGGAFVAKDPLVSAIARRLPVSLEQRVGDVAYTQILATERLIDDPAVIDPLMRVANRIQEASGSERYDFRLVVADDAAVNAFALPGGRLVINSGLILKATTSEQIAGVMAHEIAHVTRQHSMRNLMSNLGLFALVQALFGDATGLAAVLIDGGTTLLTMRFSRDFEREADEQGLLYLADARIDPNGMVGFFRMLLEENEQRGAGSLPASLALLSSHPATEERIAALETKSVRMKKRVTQSLDLDLKALKAAVVKAQQQKG